MSPQTNVSLADYSTMRLGGQAAYLTVVNTRQDIQTAVGWAKSKQVPWLVIGGGSNIVWRDEGFDGLVIVNKITGFEQFEEDSSNVYLNVGAGELWDSVVERSVAAGLTGIEALSLIPGTAGATPVQNVGAYGQEIAQVLVSVEAFDTKTDQFINLQAADCALAYRDSRFKTGPDRGRFIISGITLHLTRGQLQPPFYAALDKYFADNKITDHSPAAVRASVIAIRQSKLPNPAEVANNGSFFANPIIEQSQFLQIQASSPVPVPSWPMDDHKVKLPAAWLLEQTGFKDVHDSETGMATWPVQPLVLVNESAQSTAQLLAFKQKIVTAVEAKFGITLAQEPELLP